MVIHMLSTFFFVVGNYLCTSNQTLKSICLVKKKIYYRNIVFNISFSSTTSEVCIGAAAQYCYLVPSLDLKVGKAK